MARSISARPSRAKHPAENPRRRIIGCQRLVEAAHGAQHLGAPGARDGILREVADGAVVGCQRLVEAAHGAQHLRAPVARDGILRKVLDGAVVGCQRLVEAAHGTQRLGAPGCARRHPREVADGALYAASASLIRPLAFNNSARAAHTADHGRAHMAARSQSARATVSCGASRVARLVRDIATYQDRHRRVAASRVESHLSTPPGYGRLQSARQSIRLG